MSNPVNMYQWLKERLASVLGTNAWKLTSVDDGSVKVQSLDSGQITIFEHNCDKTIPASDEIPRVLVGELCQKLPGIFFDALPEDASPEQVIRTIKNGHELCGLRQLEHEQEKGLKRREYEVGQLVEIGKSLSAVRDVDKLLNLILEKARFLSGADAGSIYVVEGDNEEITQRKLRFKLSQNDSISYESAEFSMPVSRTSIAGAAVVLKETINIPDVRKISSDASYGYDSSWDERTGYHTRSILAVPMINLDGEVLGVVQLINKKRNPDSLLKKAHDFDNEVVPMDSRTQEILETLASQAGVAMENAFLYDDIKHIFEGFVRASVHAIEQRDPTTSGHSFRVAALTRRLAEEVSKATDGKFSDHKYDDVQLHEIETAGLLHDFGKVGVREEVLVKAKKLYPPTLKMIRSRFDFVKRSIENDHLHRRLMMMEQGTPDEELKILDQACARAVGEIEECWRIICSANEPTVLQEGDFQKIKDIASRTYFDLGGSRQSYLEASEVESLQVAKGSLTSEELEEIRSHAAHSISFLEQIPWGKSLRFVPEIAGAHHEKLDGTGYPNGLVDEQIPLPAKMMAVADIYDALTASDRPYKKAVSHERALHILSLEAKDGHIDSDLVELFENAHVFDVIEAK